jgi:iron complex transport system ATP-binding protein
MEENALLLKNVSVVRDGNRILDSVDLSIRNGENVAVIGPNGSGKTTLMKLLRGDILPYYDEDSPAVFRLFGQDLWDIFDIRSRMGLVSMDLQSGFSDDTLVSEAILSGYFSSLDVFRNHDVTEDMMRAVLDSATRMGLDGLLDRELGKLSLGEMRRTLIARALITEPGLLVLDEPMTGLDIVMKSRFRRMFDILIGNGVSIVMITHDLEEIPSKVERVVMMKEGKVFADGPKQELLTSGNLSELFEAEISVESDGMSYHMSLDEGSS